MIRILLTTLIALGISACAKTQKEAPKQEPAAQSSAVPSKTAAPMKKTDGDKEAIGHATTKCVSGDDVRMLAIVSKGKGCEVTYTKFGNSSVVATSMNSVDHCEDVAGRIQKKLEGAGYSCK